MAEKKKTKAQIQKEKWIEDTQMFQRIAKVEVSSTETLSAEWDTFKGTKRKEREVKRAEEHRAIQDMARLPRRN